MTADLSDGQTFGPYRLLALAGTGGMGVVYRAEQVPLRRVVALKVIRPEVAEAGDYRARFLREARLAAAVDHPHIVPVFDFGEQAGRLYMAMQWVDGVELQRLIDRQQRLDPARAVRIVTQVAAALDAIHNVGMLHRDIKPANVLVRDISGEDHAYLADFGIAKIAEAGGGLTRTGLMVGTSGYLSPEQIRGQRPDARSDLYALGCVTFEALTGRHPFAGENDLALLWAHVSSRRPVASQVCPSLSRRYDEFLTRALAVDPGHRFQSGREFGAALEAARAGRADIGAATSAAATAQATRPARRRPSGTGPETVTARVPPQGKRGERWAGPPQAARIPGPQPASAWPPGPAASPKPSRRAPEPAGRPSRGYAGRIVAAAGCLVFLASVTVLHSYVNNGGGWKSLWQATHGDRTSPLYSEDFWIPVTLAVLVLLGAALTVPARGRLAMGVTTAAALGLTGYLLYLPAIGASPGFAPYGTSYWVSVAAAVVSTLAAAAAALRSGTRRR
jgi:predicted Ser/Thr protein kinase